MKDIAEKNRSRSIRVLGWALLLVGAFFGILGPLETVCFPMFLEGGSCHYAGFGPGSFMFGVIAAQIILYCLCAAVLLPLGYGHIRLRGWAWKLSVPFLRVWLSIGILVVLAALFVLAGTKDLSPALAVLASAFILSCYFVFPALLMRFYRNEQTVASWNIETRTRLLDSMPPQVLTLCILCAFYIVLMQIYALFSVPFPVFGALLAGESGLIAAEISAAVFALLTWGLLRRRVWVWRAAIAFLSLLLASHAVTFSLYSYSDILSAFRYPPVEAEILANLPLQGWHVALLLALPYAGGFIAAILARKHISAGEKTL